MITFSRNKRFSNINSNKIHGYMEYLLTWLHRNHQEYLNLIVETSTAETLRGWSHKIENCSPLCWRCITNKRRCSTTTSTGVRSRSSASFNRIRPIVRGEAKVKFGAKIGASIMKGYTFIDCHSREVYNECEDLMIHLKNYKRRFGLLPKKVEADKIYFNRRNQVILKLLKIKISDKPLRWPPKEQ